MISDDSHGPAATIYETPRSRRLMIPVTGFFITAGAASVATASTIPVLARLPSMILVPLGVILLFSGLRGLRDERPILIISSGGLKHIQFGFMPWQAIASVEIRSAKVRLPGSLLSSTKRLEIGLRTPQEPRQYRTRFQVRRNPRISQMSVYPYSIEAILADMRRHYPELIVRPST